MRPEKLAVVGQGYVGLPLAIRAAEVGFDVVGFDIDEDKVKRLAAGESQIGDISNERLRAALANGYRPTTDPADIAGFDVAAISVPTPLRDTLPDLSFIEAASRTIATHVRPGCTVVLESTTYPGTTEELVGPLLEEGSGLSVGVDFHLGYSPERIDPGNKRWTLANTPKIVSGVDEASLAAVKAFFDRIVEHTVTVKGTREAELSKLLENTFRHVNIALVNELAIFAHDLGIDIWEAIDAASTKPFGFIRFEPGPGVGGHCLPIDPSYLSWQVRRSLGRSSRFVELAHDVNNYMPDYVVQRVVLGLNERGLPLRGSRILLLGLTYKRNSADTRESPSIAVAEKLVRLGATVLAADPYVVNDHVPPGVALVTASPEQVATADVVVVLVDHDAFDLPALAAASSYMFDCRRAVERSNVERL